MSEVCLSPMAPSDQAFLRDLRSNPLVADWLFSPTRLITPEEQELWYNEVKADARHQVWVARTTTERVGYGQVYDINLTHMSAEIGVAVVPPFQKQGYGEQIILKLLKWCFEDVGLNSVRAEVFCHNAAAITMFRRCKFQLNGWLPERRLKQGKFRDTWMMMILRREYDSRDSSRAG